jgi:dipeptide transport system substrate-binding protein
MTMTRFAIAAAALFAPALAALGIQSAAAADTLVVCTEASPDTMNANLSTANTTFDVSEQVADRLVEMQPGTSNLVPGLAESWDISSDGLRYTFHLRHGVKWQSSASFHPNRDFNADDVMFTFRRMFDKNHPWNKVGGGYPMFDALIAPPLKAVTKIDNDTVAFELNRPHAPLLPTLSVQSFSITSAEYAAAIDKAGGTRDSYDLNPIGTGPFQFVQYQKDSLIRFRAFHDFWGAKGAQPERAAKVDQLVFAITRDPAVRFAKLRANECQVARYPNPADIPAMRATPGVVVQEATIASVGYLAFNTQRKPFDDARVRQALASAVDLDSLVKAVWQGSGTPTASVVSPGLFGHSDTLQPRHQDLARAKALLAEAGLGNGFNIELWAIPVARAYMPDGRRAAEMIQADWAKIGVNAKIVSYEWGEYLRRARNGEGDAAMLGGTWDYPDPSQQLIGLTCEALDTGRNTPKGCNRAYSDLIDQANKVTDISARAKLYQQAQQIIYDEVPIMTFADTKVYVPVRTSVSGFKLHFFGGQPFGGVAVTQ